MRRTLIATTLAASLSVPAVANEYTTYVPLPVTPLGAAGSARCDTLALLNLPANWRTGDAIVVMLTAGPAYNPQRDPLIAALLAEDAAVLEVSPAMPAVCADGSAEAAGRAPRPDPLDLVFGSLLAARGIAGSGLAVAIGHGPGGRLALVAADEAEANRRLGPDGPRFAAALALDGGRTGFRLGSAQTTPVHADQRLAFLCEALVRAGAAQGAANGRACAAELGASMVSARALPSR